MFFNKETGIFMVYDIDSYIDIGPAVYFYANEQRRLMDYAPV